MDINDILNNLGLDLTNPEVKRGALEAIEAILDSRRPPMPLDNINGGGSGGETDVELDPDLLQPSQKHRAPENQNDIEINDEEHILDQIRQNNQEDKLEDNSVNSDSSSRGQATNGGETSESDSESEGSTAASSEEEIASDTGKNRENSSQEMPSEEKADSSSNNGNQENDDSNNDEDITEPFNNKDADESSENVDDKTSNSQFDSETADDDGGGESVDGDTEVANDSAEKNETEPTQDTDDGGEESFEDGAIGEFEDAEDTNEDDFDEDDLLDDELKNTYEDEGIKTKHEARKIKRERTLQAAKKALSDAKTKNVSTSLVKELESAIAALEALTEAVKKSIKEVSDEEFNRLINRVFDAISAVGDSSLTFSSEEEREMQAQEIKADLASSSTQAELSAEDIAQIRAETQAVKARDKESAKYQKKSRKSFKGFQDFLNSLYRAIALQVSAEEARDDSWSAINRRNSGSGVLLPGKRIQELSNKKIPVIDFYFDCSGSWTDTDVEIGKKAVSLLTDMEADGKIKVNIYYFSNHVFNDDASARYEGGTRAWNEIVKNVISTQATNVIIMTDEDMEDWWHPQDQPPLRYTVPGYVWYLWRNGENAPRLPRDLKGRGGVQQFSFNHGDL